MPPAIRRGDIFSVILDPTVGKEIAKTRPCVIIQNDIGNKYSPVTIVACITSNLKRAGYPTSVFIAASETELSLDSVILLNQIRTVDKIRLEQKIGRVPPYKMKEVDEAIELSLDLS
jgi:mRNA interferase MazF